jgi:predicted CoA-binding protein
MKFRERGKRGRNLVTPVSREQLAVARGLAQGISSRVDHTGELPRADLGDLRRLLADSADPANPTAEALRDLLARARRIAVVGISRHPEKPSRSVPAYLAARGYEIVPVNPNADRVLGRKATARLADVEEPVDMVMIFRPSDQAGAFVLEAAARPERPAIWLSEGIRADVEVSAARARGVTAVQDLCAYKAYEAIRPEDGPP